MHKKKESKGTRSPHEKYGTKKTLNTICPPKISFIDSRRLLQILATSFSPKTRAKMRERREWERWEKFEHNNSRQRIDEK
jgi:hypothetical protein